MSKKYPEKCPVSRTMAVIGATWTPLIMRDLLLHGALRFQDFIESLENIPPTTLSSRIKTLEKHGIIVRCFYMQHPPRAKYTLTEKGKSLGPIIREMQLWGQKYGQ